MENLPDDVLLKIYRFKHNLEFHGVMEELLQFKVYCHFAISLKQARHMVYFYNRIKAPCLNVSNIDVSSRELLNQITNI